MPSYMDKQIAELREKVNLRWDHVKHSYPKDPDPDKRKLAHRDVTMAYLKGDCPRCDEENTFVAWSDGQVHMKREPICTACMEVMSYIEDEIREAARFGPPEEEAPKKAKVQRENPPPLPTPVAEEDEVIDVSTELIAPSDLAGLPGE